MPGAVVLLACVAFAVGSIWLHGREGSLFRPFATLTVGMVAMTLVGLVAALAGSFRPLILVPVLAAVTVFGAFLPRSRQPTSLLGATPSQQWIAAAVFTLGLVAYLPTYPTPFAASDATTYTAAGGHLYRSGQLWLDDEFAPLVPAALQSELFPSGVVVGDLPPHMRISGGLSLDEDDPAVVWPAFFPVPIVWAGWTTALLGPKGAGEFAALFSALALVATWLFLRRRLTGGQCAVATGLVGLNAATYWTAHMPLSEPIAWFFLFAGLVALDAWEEHGQPTDAAIAAASLTTAAITRLDLAVLVAAAMAVRALTQNELGGRSLPGAFYAVIAASVALAWATVELSGAAQLAPIRAAVYDLELKSFVGPGSFAAKATVLGAIGVAIAWFVVGRLGRGHGVLALTGAALLFVGTSPDDPVALTRSLGWLSGTFGWPCLILAAGGFVHLWLARQGRSGDGFVVLLAALVIAVVVGRPNASPILPWASRRFVPLLAPAVVLAASVAASAITVRWRWVGVATWALLAWSVLSPARPFWGQAHYQGSHAQLEQFEASLPPNDPVLIDRALAEYLLGIPLMLRYDRSAFNVDAQSFNGRGTITRLADALGHEGVSSFALVTTADVALGEFPGLSVEPHAQVRFDFELPATTTGKPAARPRRLVQELTVYRLESLHRKTER